MIVVYDLKMFEKNLLKIKFLFGMKKTIESILEADVFF